MSGIIRLLDAHVCNQLAAGEVVPSPAYIVKELLENAIDAGASDISVYIIGGGKNSVRVVDNGKGMTPQDALVCFQKHATSKIQNANDLSHVLTMGFRGEALAAIAAVCKVVLKTKVKGEKMGFMVNMEYSQKQSESLVAMENGTDIEAKNLFFNLPVRKNFLNTDAIENAHNRREFLHVAIAYPEKSFRFYEDGKMIYHLASTPNMGNRIIQIYPKYRNKLLPLKIDLDFASIEGFIGVPSLARRSGDKYFFINRRYINNYRLQYLIRMAYDNLLEAKDKKIPFYCLNFNMDPSKVDVNIHPNKQEVRFSAQDEQLLGIYLKAAARKVLDNYAMNPIDFSMGDSFHEIPALNSIPVNISEVRKYNPLFENYTQKNSAHVMGQVNLDAPKSWDNFYDSQIISPTIKTNSSNEKLVLENFKYIDWEYQSFFQIYREWILTTLDSGLLFLHQQRIHQHILFHRYQTRFKKGIATNEYHHLLFPEKLHIEVSDIPLFEEILPVLKQLGYLIVKRSDSDDYWVEACPSSKDEQSLALDIDKLLVSYALDKDTLNRDECIIRAMALRKAVKVGKELNENEMRNLVSNFFAIPDLSSLQLNSLPFVFKERGFLQ